MNRRWLVLSLVCLGILISYIDRGNLSIAAASIMRDFALSPGAMGTLLSAFFWTYATLQIPAGAAVDRFGIKRVYAGAFLMWSLASAGIAFAGGFTSVLIPRMILGIAEAAGPLASISFIRRNFSGREQGLPTAIYISGQTLGPAIGTLLGSVLIAKLGWRAMFLFTGLGALIWLPFWLWLAPADKPGPAKDAPKIVVPAACWPWKRLLASRAFWAMCVSDFLASYYWYFVLTWVPAYLTLSRGFTTLEMGRVLSTPLFIVAGVIVVAGYAADKLVVRMGSVFGVRVAFGAVAYLCAASLLLLRILPERGSVLPILTLSMCGIGVGNSNFWAIAQHTPPSHMVGRTIGFLNTVSQIAGATAPLITGWTLGPEKNFAVAIVIAGVCPVLASGFLLMAGARGLEKVRLLLAGEENCP